MKILFAGTKFPLPATNGQAIRTLSVITALAELGHEVAMITFAPEATPASLEPLSSCCRSIETIASAKSQLRLSTYSGYGQRIGCLLRGEPFSVERFRSEAMRRALARHLEGGGMDAVVCDSLYAMVNLPPTDVPVVLNCHNVEHMIYERFADLARNPAQRLYARIEGAALRTVEAQACGRATVALVCSEQDRTMLLALRPGLQAEVAPNVVDVDRLAPPAGRVPAEAQTLLFSGGMDWYPNRDAVDFFARDIFPLVRAQAPEVRLVVAGRNPPAAWAQRLGRQPGIELTGTVADMRPYLWSATLVVVPLRMGSGTRIKILEACAAGKAVVSTRVGAEGLSLRDGEAIVLADEPAEFAARVLELLQNPARREAIAAAGQQATRAQYGPDAFRAVLARALATVAAAGGAAPAIGTRQV